MIEDKSRGQVGKFLDELGLGWDYDIHDLLLRLAAAPRMTNWGPASGADFQTIKLDRTMNAGESLTFTFQLKC